MKDFWDLRIQLRIGLTLLLTTLLGLAVLPHAVRRDFETVPRTKAPLEAAARLARLAQRQVYTCGLWERAGRAALAGGEALLAASYLKQAARRSDLSLQGQILLGELLEAQGDVEAAVATWQAALAGSPDSSASQMIYEHLLAVHTRQKLYPQMVTDLKALLALKPGDGNRHYRLGLVLLTQDPQAALPVLEQAAALDPSLENAVSDLRRALIGARPAEERAYLFVSAGQALANLEAWDLASEAFRQATVLRPDYAEAWAYRGEALQHTSADPSVQTAQAFEFLQKALVLDPHSLAAHTFLGLYWQRQGRFDRALESLQRAAAADPTNPTLQMQVGSVYAIQGDLAAALQAFQEAVRLAPRDARPLYFLADFSLKHDYYVDEIALPAARRAAALDGRDPANLDLMAQVLIRHQDFDTAQRFLERALQTTPGYAPAHLHLGLVHIYRGELERARWELQRARSLDSGGSIATQAQQLLQTYFP